MSRKYPLAKPPGHKPPMERWKLEFDSPTTIHTTYIGVQRHGSTSDSLLAYTKAIDITQASLDSAKTTSEKFTFIEGDDAPESTTWVCYHTSRDPTSGPGHGLHLRSIYEALGKPSTIGLWKESFSTPTSRLETNYSGLDYLPGLAQLPSTRSNPVAHTLTAYWGAARDRIPESASDLFSLPSADEDPISISISNSASKQRSLGRYVHGTNNLDNIVHIRSGQFWENCTDAERQAYEENLEPALREGLRYVWNNRSESGALGLRFLRNSRSTYARTPITPSPSSHEDELPNLVKETSAAGFFRNLSDLERWAKGHPSHHAIFNGAIKHARRFGAERKMRTWHEVSVLKRGEVCFEYLNCVPETGVVRFCELEGSEV
ncbi:phenylacetaldoxime dehydratase family protein [Aspergillus undulatus]|uniref:phenylacetaldoxime dehydratase family protein n=1 Tax=Aspergillus undulatus TaxID=1810928 RepID=UPI003CCE03B1